MRISIWSDEHLPCINTGLSAQQVCNRVYKEDVIFLGIVIGKTNIAMSTSSESGEINIQIESILPIIR